MLTRSKTFFARSDTNGTTMGGIFWDAGVFAVAIVVGASSRTAEKTDTQHMR